MATIAEMLIGGAQRTAEATGENLQRGAQLAQSVEAIQQGRQQVEQAKVKLQMDKADRIMTAIEKGSQFKDKAAQNAFFKNYVPGLVKALKMEDFFTPDLMNYVQASEEVRNKLIGLRLDIQDKVQRGELRGAEIFNYAKSKLNPEELPLLDTDSLLEQQKFAASEEGKAFRAQTIAQATTERARESRQEAGDVEARKQVAKSWGSYQTAGGSAAYEKSINAYQDAINALKSGDVEFGTLTKKLPLLSSEDALSRYDEKAKALVDRVRDAINIRAKTGDPNPTEKQINLILSRSIDPRLSNAENIKKLQSEIDRMQTEDIEKRKAFQQAGFLPRSSKESAKRENAQRVISARQKVIYRNASPEMKETILQRLESERGISREEARKQLGE